MARTTICVAAALLGLLAAREARACGGFFTETSSTEVASMSDIRVVLVKLPQQVQQYVQVAYTGSATRFAWVYPVPANPEVKEIKEDIFAQLEEATRPRITISTLHDSGGSGGFGCGGDDAAGMDRKGGENVDPTVTVWQQGQVGAFDYAVLSATTAQDLLDWLNTNGFQVPTSTKDVVGHYLAQGWLFVAMKVSMQDSGSAGVPGTTIVRFTYDANGVRYPLKMVSLSPAARTDIDFYLVSLEHGHELQPAAPFTAVPIDRTSVKALSPETHNYEQVFDAAMAQAGQRGMVEEFSGLLSGEPVALISSSAVVTRFRASFTPDDMDQDIDFDVVSYNPMSSEYFLEYYESSSKAAAPPLLILLLLVWRWRATRRR